MKLNNVLVFNYVKANDGKNFVAGDIAAALDLDVRAVNGIITKTFCHHKEDGVELPLMERVPGCIKTITGKIKDVQFIKLTEAGRNFIAVPDEEGK